MFEIFISHTAEETLDFAAKMAKTCQTPCVIALHGDLGAGKSVFARGFARGLGVTEVVQSPTFTILQEYALENGKRLCHFDLYRLTDYVAALDFGFDEYVADAENICLIEWSERATELLPKHTWHVTLNRSQAQNADGDEIREIMIRKD